VLIALAQVGCATMKPRPRPILIPISAKFQCTAPAMDNWGTCSERVLVPAKRPMSVRWRWSGGEDSAAAFPRDTVNIVVPALYGALRVWAERGGAIGCDTSITQPSR